MVDWRFYGSLNPKSVTTCNYFSSTGSVHGSSDSFASVGGSTFGSVLGDSFLSVGYPVPAVDGSVFVASPCHSSMGIPTEISFIPDIDSLPRPHPLILCPSSPPLTAASTLRVQLVLLVTEWVWPVDQLVVQSLVDQLLLVIQLLLLVVLLLILL